VTVQGGKGDYPKRWLEKNRNRFTPYLRETQTMLSKGGETSKSHFRTKLSMNRGQNKCATKTAESHICPQNKTTHTQKKQKPPQPESGHRTTGSNQKAKIESQILTRGKKEDEGPSPIDHSMSTQISSHNREGNVYGTTQVTTISERDIRN